MWNFNQKFSKTFRGAIPRISVAGWGHHSSHPVCQPVLSGHLILLSSLLFIYYETRTTVVQKVYTQHGSDIRHRQCRINANRGLWQLFARGPLLTRDKDLSKLVNYMHASESTLDSGTSGTASHSSRHDMLAIISSRYQYGPFLFCCCCRSRVKLLDY